VSLARAIAAAIAPFVIAVAAAGCPSRELVVKITNDAADTLSLSCVLFRDACSNAPACKKNRLICDANCKLQNACDLGDGRPEWDSELVMGMQLLLLQPSGTGFALAAKSPCVPLNLGPCVPGACPDATSTGAACVKDALTVAVQAAVGNGFGFDGFKSPDEVVFAAAFFQKPGKPGGEKSCEATALVGPGTCVEANLVAAGGLAAPFGSDSYDLTCASCQKGPHSALGRDNEACPTTDDACFLQRVAAVLK
jgi:hypothetical protein